MAGTWGEWNEGDFNSCSEPCGGGKINRYRICLYPPCVGEAFELSDRECNTQECHAEVGFKLIELGWLFGIKVGINLKPYLR